MVTYQNAPTKSLRTQIPSIYANRFSANELKRIHQPFQNLFDRQIKIATGADWGACWKNPASQNLYTTASARLLLRVHYEAILLSRRSQKCVGGLLSSSNNLHWLVKVNIKKNFIPDWCKTRIPFFFASICMNFFLFTIAVWSKEP